MSHVATRARPISNAYGNRLGPRPIAVAGLLGVLALALRVCGLDRANDLFIDGAAICRGLAASRSSCTRRFRSPWTRWSSVCSV